MKILLLLSLPLILASAAATAVPASGPVEAWADRGGTIQAGAQGAGGDVGLEAGTCGSGSGNNNGNSNVGDGNGNGNSGNNNGNNNVGDGNGNDNSGSNNGNNNAGSNNGNRNATDNNGNNGVGDNRGNGSAAASGRTANDIESEVLRLLDGLLADHPPYPRGLPQ